MAKTKKPAGPEYRLLITPRFDERRQLYTTLFLLETVQFFASFQYELSVKEKIVGKSITYKVLGLNAPQLSLPAVGHAQFIRQYEGLNGTYEFTIEGIDGRSSAFSVKISPKKVQLLKAPAEKLVEVIADELKMHS